MALVLVSYSICVLLLLQVHRPITANLAKVECRGGSRGGDWGDRPPKTYESNFFHHDFVQFGKTLHCQLRLDCQILLKSPPLNLRAGSAPG